MKKSLISLCVFIAVVLVSAAIYAFWGNILPESVSSNSPVSTIAFPQTQPGATTMVASVIAPMDMEASVSPKLGGELLISWGDQPGVALVSVGGGKQQQLLDFAPGMVSISLDGDRLAYLSDGIVFVQDLHSLETAQFAYETSGNISGQMAWSPDGTNIGFGCYSDTTFHRELCLLNVENGERQELTNFLQLGVQSDTAMDGAQMGNWSADGSRIVFITRILPETNGHARGAIQIYHTADGSIQTVLDETQITGLVRLAAPSISPDGEVILFSAKAGDNYAIYRVNFDGSQLERVTPETFLFDISNPIWSPDGEFFVAFTQDQDLQETRGVPTIFNLDGEIIAQFDIEGTAFEWISR